MDIAWSNCEFCSKSSYEIKTIILDRKRWDELPLGHKCGWKRICTVGFGPFGRKSLWSDLCTERAEVNNELGEPWKHSEWTEGYCRAYRDAEIKRK